jgi:hypothetical protein
MTIALAGLIWGLFTNQSTRNKFLKEFQDGPLKSLFILLWLILIYMFGIGILIPFIGNEELFQTG